MKANLCQRDVRILKQCLGIFHALAHDELADGISRVLFELHGEIFPPFVEMFRHGLRGNLVGQVGVDIIYTFDNQGRRFIGKGKSGGSSDIIGSHGG